MKRFLACLLVVLSCATAVLAEAPVIDPDHTVQVNVPGGWVVSPSKQAHSVVIMSTDRPGAQMRIQYLPDVTISKDPQWVAHFREELRQRLPDVTFGQQSDVRVSGQPAVRIDVMQKDVPMSFVLVTGQQRSWLVSISAPTRYEYDRMIKQLLGGLQLL